METHKDPQEKYCECAKNKHSKKMRKQKGKEESPPTSKHNQKGLKIDRDPLTNTYSQPSHAPL